MTSSLTACYLLLATDSHHIPICCLTHTKDPLRSALDNETKPGQIKPSLVEHEPVPTQRNLQGGHTAEGPGGPCVQRRGSDRRVETGVWTSPHPNKDAAQSLCCPTDQSEKGRCVSPRFYNSHIADIVLSE